MGYRIVKDFVTPNTVELRYSYTGRWIGVILFCLGGASLVIIGMLYGNTDMEWPLHIVGPGMGFLFLGAGLGMASPSKVPQRLIFDNRYGILRVIQRASDSDDQGAYIGFNEIEGFYIQEYIKHRGNGHYKSYKVVMRKHDGAVWVLWEGSLNWLTKLYQELREKVKLHVPPTHRPVESQAGIFDVQPKDTSTTISWPVKNSIAIISMLVLISAGICTLVSLIKIAPLKYILWLLAGGLFGVLPLVSTLASLGARCIVKVTAQELSFTRESPMSQQSFQVAVDQIVAVMFNFNPAGGDDGIYIRREDEMRQGLAVLEDGVDWRDIGQLIRMAFKQTVIPTNGLTVVQKVWLEQLIQQALQRHGHQIKEEQKQLLHQFLTAHNKVNHGAIRQDLG